MAWYGIVETRAHRTTQRDLFWTCPASHVQNKNEIQRGYRRTSTKKLNVIYFDFFLFLWKPKTLGFTNARGNRWLQWLYKYTRDVRK